MVLPIIARHNNVYKISKKKQDSFQTAHSDLRCVLTRSGLLSPPSVVVLNESAIEKGDLYKYISMVMEIKW